MMTTWKKSLGSPNVLQIMDHNVKIHCHGNLRYHNWPNGNASNHCWDISSIGLTNTAIPRATRGWKPSYLFRLILQSKRICFIEDMNSWTISGIQSKINHCIHLKHSSALYLMYRMIFFETCKWGENSEAKSDFTEWLCLWGPMWNWTKS